MRKIILEINSLNGPATTRPKTNIVSPSTGFGDPKESTFQWESIYLITMDLSQAIDYYVSESLKILPSLIKTNL